MRARFPTFPDWLDLSLADLLESFLVAVVQEESHRLIYFEKKCIFTVFLQIAFIEQLIAKGIPIDMVGGTSIGSLVGALYAKYRDVETMNVHMKDFCKRMSSLFTKVLDITYPITGNDEKYTHK